MSLRDTHVKYRLKLTAMAVLDAFSIALAYMIGLYARFDFSMSAVSYIYRENTYRFILLAIPVTLLAYWIGKLYNSVWRFVSINELYRIIVVYAALAVVLSLTSWNIPLLRIPRTSMFIALILSFIFCCIIRFAYRFYWFLVQNRRGKDSAEADNVLLIGAGQAAREIISDVRTGHHEKYHIKAIVDDNAMKKGRMLDGVMIAGGRQDIPELVRKYDIDRIIFAITNISPKEKTAILNICKETGCHLQIIPALSQLYSGEVTVSKLKDVEIDDLLGRDEVKVNNDQIFASLRGKVVMVTGAGGSIGSELSRQIANAGPKQLILFDIYENSTYEIELELKKNYPQLDLVTLIGDITDQPRVAGIMDRYHPEVIYHAAAHKHVPLMEDSPNEAIKNNVMGTWTLTEEAWKHHVSRFLQISTDKAVNPTNIMGASKRLCEMIIQMQAREHPDTVFMAVRFGNVLGSNGSVIPLFKKQIAHGGPVTVTDRNIIRYFMTIPEAVSLVLQASYYAKGGEIFVLDMGKPVRIDDMARNLIKLSGYKPDVDIKIVYTGLRPGEKLYEEMLMDEEGMSKTENNLIYIGHPLKFSDEEFRKQLKMLDEASQKNVDNIEEIVASVLPTYHPYHTSAEPDKRK